jgi:RNA polymerase sigma-70 factor (ECF subfamily)
MNRSNEQWLSDLSTPGPAQEAALADLRTTILSGLPYALSKWLSLNDPQFESLAEEVTQETLLRVLDRMDTFEGRSKFTTWVHTIAVRLALTELRRRKWRDVSLDGLIEEQPALDSSRLMADTGPGPERSTEQADMMARVRNVIMEDLTERQRQAMVAIGIHGMPIEEVARRMNTERNALYKLMHDARLRLKRRLAQEGLSPADVMAVFEQG